APGLVSRPGAVGVPGARPLAVVTQTRPSPIVGFLLTRPFPLSLNFPLGSWARAGNAEGSMRGEASEAKGPGTGDQRQHHRRGQWRGDWRRPGVDAAWSIPNGSANGEL